MRIGIVGTGRMGHSLRSLAEASGYTVVAQAGRPDASFWQALREAQIVLDFSHATQTRSVVEACLSQGLALVTGTTGWHGEAEALQAFARRIPNARWVWGGNFSRGIILLKALLQTIRQHWPEFPDWQAALFEIHHSRKKDAPSGTALELQKHAPPLHDLQSLRVGEIIGEHTLLLSGPGEGIELRHRAHDRATFARGALWAAQKLLEQSAFIGPVEQLWQLR